MGLPWCLLHWPLYAGTASGGVPKALSVAVVLLFMLLPSRVLTVWVSGHTPERDDRDAHARAVLPHVVSPRLSGDEREGALQFGRVQQRRPLASQKLDHACVPDSATFSPRAR